MTGLTCKERFIIDAKSLQSRLSDLSAIGSAPTGGDCCLAAGREDWITRDRFRTRLHEEDRNIAADAVDNFFGIAELGGSNTPLVLTSSHLDSQPSGSRCNGAYGVLTGLDAVLTMCPPNDV